MGLHVARYGQRGLSTDVLRLIAAGPSNRDIAQELALATGAIKKHVNNTFTKLNVRSRAQAVSQAGEFNLL